MNNKTCSEDYQNRTKTDQDMIYLCTCAVNGTRPNIESIEAVHKDELFEETEKQLLSSAVGMALESAGIKWERFTRAIAIAQRKNALLDADRMKVLSALEEAGIWYMPLKGSVLKDMYPRYGMRQMADNDILFDSSRRNDVKRIMEGLGFRTEHYEFGNHDVYHKEPVSNFEMHAYLINRKTNDKLATYYQDVKERLIKDKGNQYGYHFTDEDFYLYLVAHEYKHYTEGGTGLRSLLDTYVFLKQKERDLNWGYIRQEAERMEVSEFEEMNRKLAMHLFREEPLSAEEQKMLDYVLSSGAYGTLENETNNQIERKGRWGYFFSRLYLSHDDMLREYPVLKRVPILYPVMLIWRFIYRFFTSHKKFMYQLKAALGLEKPDQN